MAAPHTRRIAKSAKTGKIVKLAYALAHPATTFVQTIFVGKKRGKKGK